MLQDGEHRREKIRSRWHIVLSFAVSGCQQVQEKVTRKL